MSVSKHKIPKLDRVYAVVRGSSGRKTFKKWHKNQSEAWAEAERLALKEGGLFVVIEAKAKIVGRTHENKS